MVRGGGEWREVVRGGMEKIESGEGWYWGRRKRGSFWVASVMYVILISQVTLPDGVSSPQVSVQGEVSSP